MPRAALGWHVAPQLHTASKRWHACLATFATSLTSASSPLSGAFTTCQPFCCPVLPLCLRCTAPACLLSSGQALLSSSSHRAAMAVVATSPPPDPTGRQTLKHGTQEAIENIVLHGMPPALKAAPGLPLFTADKQPPTALSLGPAPACPPICLTAARNGKPVLPLSSQPGRHMPVHTAAADTRQTARGAACQPAGHCGRSANRLPASHRLPRLPLMLPGRVELVAPADAAAGDRGMRHASPRHSAWNCRRNDSMCACRPSAAARPAPVRIRPRSLSSFS